MSWLDALDVRKNILQPMGIGWLTMIKQLLQMGNTIHDIILQTALWRWWNLAFVRNDSGVLVESYGHVNIKSASLQYYVAY